MNEMNMNTQQNAAGMPNDMKIDDKAIKKMAGEAIGQVEGVLGLEGGIVGMLKSDDDVTKGLGITLSEDGKTASVSCKIITEYGKNIPEIVGNVQDKVRESLQRMAGLTVDKVEVEVTDTMTREDYQAKTSKGRSLS
ncbi:MAG: Asp23/Gls24 family envelope stress response protein [Oscillospiraceae bacterium]